MYVLSCNRFLISLQDIISTVCMDSVITYYIHFNQSQCVSTLIKKVGLHILMVPITTSPPLPLVYIHTMIQIFDSLLSHRTGMV